MLATDLKDFRRACDHLERQRKRLENAFIELLSHRQYKAWNKYLRKLREDFRASHNDLLGLRFLDELPTSVSRSKKVNMAYREYVKAYKAWLVNENRSEMYLIEGGKE